MEKEKKVKETYYDLKLLVPVLLLVGLGIVMVYSASSAVAMKKYGSGYFFLKKQTIAAIVGIAAMFFCRHLPFRYYQKFVYPILGLSLLGLALLWVPGFGHNVGGATRWLKIGSLTFQPTEFVRLAMIIYLAYSLDKKKDQIKKFSVGFLPHFIAISIFAGLIIIQPDFGSAALLGAVTWIMLFLGGVRILHLSAGLAAILPFAYFFLINAEYRLKRLLSFINPWQYSTDEGYQAIHSLMAFGTGGLFGTGIGKGYQKLFYLPEPHTDFIFSVIGEELGFIGALFIIGLYALIIIRGVIISRNTDNMFACLLGAGITATIGLQVCINMGVTLGLLPTKGLTLPFLSYGGTSLVFSMAMAGILMNIEASQKK